MNRWPWHGVVAVILAVCVGGSYAAVLVIAAWRGGADGEGFAALDHLGGILAGALAGWLGGSAVAHRRKQDDDDSAP